MKTFFLILLLLYFANLFAQNSNNPINNYFRAYFFLEYSKKYYEIDIQKALQCADNGIVIADKMQNSQLLSALYFSKAKIFDYNSKYDSSFVYYQKAYPQFIVTGDSISVAKCLINIGVNYYYYGYYDSALIHYQMAEKFLLTSNEIILKSKVYNNLGLVHKSRGNYFEAIINFQKVIDLLENTDYKINIANALLNIGILNWEQKNYDKALENYRYSLQIYKNLAFQEDIANTYNNIGLVYSGKFDTINAIMFYDKAIHLYSAINNKKGKASALINKAVLLNNKINHQNAELLFHEALNLYQSINYNLGIFITKTNLSLLYSNTGQDSKSIAFALQATEIKDIDKPLKYLSDSYGVLAKTFSELKDYKKANEFYNKYIQIKDSIFSLEINRQITEIQMKYETEKKDIQLELYQQKINLQQYKLDNNRKKNVTTSIISIIILISAVVFIILYIQKRRSYIALVEQNIKLAKSDIEKEQLILDNKVVYQEKILKYSDTNLSAEQKKELISNIVVLMEEEKFFLNEQFTINDLAKKIGTNRNYLSQIINEHFNTNFNNFINELRVKEARKMLLSSEFKNYTIEGIAKIVGFHSKTTFNMAFKKFTGVTPSFFKNNSNFL